jgi:hypothetical protein
MDCTIQDCHFENCRTYDSRRSVNISPIKPTGDGIKDYNSWLSLLKRVNRKEEGKCL